MKQWLIQSISGEVERDRQLAILEKLMSSPEQKTDEIANLLVDIARIKRVQILVPHFTLLPAVVINFLKIFKYMPEANIHLIVTDESAKTTRKSQQNAFVNQHKVFDIKAVMAGKDSDLPNHTVINTTAMTEQENQQQASPRELLNQYLGSGDNTTTAMKHLLIAVISCFPYGISPLLLKAIMIETQLEYSMPSVNENPDLLDFKQLAENLDSLLEIAQQAKILIVDNATGFYHFASPIVIEHLESLQTGIAVSKRDDVQLTLSQLSKYDISLSDRPAKMHLIDVISSIAPMVAADLVLKKTKIELWDLVILEKAFKQWQEQGELDKISIGAGLAIAFCNGEQKHYDPNKLTAFYILKLKSATAETAQDVVSGSIKHLDELIRLNAAEQNKGLLDDKIINLISVLTDVYSGLLNKPLVALKLFTEVKKLMPEALKNLVDDPTDPATFQDDATKKKIFKHALKNSPKDLAVKIENLRKDYLAYQSRAAQAGSVLAYIREKVPQLFGDCDKEGLAVAEFIITDAFKDQLDRSSTTAQESIDTKIKEMGSELRKQFALAEYGTKLRPLALMVSNQNFAFRSLQVFTDISITQRHFTSSLLAACAVTAYFHLGGLKKKVEVAQLLIDEIGTSLNVCTSPTAVFNYYLSMHRVRAITKLDLDILMTNFKLAMRTDRGVMVGAFARFIIVTLDLVYGGNIQIRYAKKCELVAMMLAYVANNPDGAIYLLNCALVDQDQALLGINHPLLPERFITDILSAKLTTIFQDLAHNEINSMTEGTPIAAVNHNPNQVGGITISPSFYESVKDNPDALRTRYGPDLTSHLTSHPTSAGNNVSRAAIVEAERIYLAIQTLFDKTELENLDSDERSMLVLYLSKQLSGLADTMMQKLLGHLVKLEIDEAYLWARRFVLIEGLLEAKNPMPTKAPILAAILTVLAMRFHRTDDIPGEFKPLLTQRFKEWLPNSLMNQIFGAYLKPRIAVVEVGYIVRDSVQNEVFGVSAKLANEKLKKGITAVISAIEKLIKNPGNLRMHSGLEFAQILMCAANYVSVDTSSARKQEKIQSIYATAFQIYRESGAIQQCRRILQLQPDLAPAARHVKVLENIIEGIDLDASATKLPEDFPETVLTELKMLSRFKQERGKGSDKGTQLLMQFKNPLIKAAAFLNEVMMLNPQLSSQDMVNITHLTLFQLVAAYLPILSANLGIDDEHLLDKKDVQVEILLSSAQTGSQYLMLYHDLFGDSEPNSQVADKKKVAVSVADQTTLCTIAAYQKPGVVFPNEKCFGGTFLRVHMERGLIVVRSTSCTLLIHTPPTAQFQKTPMQVDLLFFALVDSVIKKLLRAVNQNSTSRENSSQASEESESSERFSIDSKTNGLLQADVWRLNGAVSSLEKWAIDGDLLSQPTYKLISALSIIKTYQDKIEVQLSEVKEIVLREQRTWLAKLDILLNGVNTKTSVLTPTQLTVLPNVHLLCINGFLTQIEHSSVLSNDLHEPMFRPPLALLILVEANALKAQLVGHKDGKTLSQRFTEMVRGLNQRASSSGMWVPHTEYGNFCLLHHCHENLFFISALWIARFTSDETLRTSVMKSLHEFVLGGSLNLIATYMRPLKALPVATPADYEAAEAHITLVMEQDTYPPYHAANLSKNIIDKSKAIKVNQLVS